MHFTYKINHRFEDIRLVDFWHGSWDYAYSLSSVTNTVSWVSYNAF